jgi:hypothetical protein
MSSDTAATIQAAGSLPDGTMRIMAALAGITEARSATRRVWAFMVLAPAIGCRLLTWNA